MRKFIGLVVISVLVLSCSTLKNNSTTSSTQNNEETEKDSIEVVEPPKEEQVKQIDEYKEQPVYRGEYTKYFDLIHTKLKVSFDWGKRYLYGEATLQLKPHFYNRDSLFLDAKSFEFHSIKRIEGKKEIDLPYKYDGNVVRIKLDKTFHRDDLLTIFIDYTAKPYERKSHGSEAITEDRGLYFINPDGTENKPQQIWTQGETEASSCWFPTIDSPNQRCTDEIYITVNKKFKTLSNGELIYSQLNGDGTKTDYWKMDKPHAPYLFMMAVGDFAVVKDEWNKKPVNYYVEPEYEQYAKDIFGNTPEMITFFSDLLDYPYPWPKYDQVVVRDYVSGAMENTTASVFMESLQINRRELIDKDWDYIIAHELFHQWFGDLVTCESWSNLTLNEGFANYSEYLWQDYKKGTEEGQYKLYDELQNYLNEAETKKVDLIRFNYDDKEDMFDNHSYSKGGLVLHMLRKTVGDEAFFASLHRYLEENKFHDVEVHNLRLAFEEVTGKDLNWFFNEWYLDKGHPVLEVEDQYIDSLKTLKLSVKQNQDLNKFPLYKFPVKIKYWVDGQQHSDSVLIEDEYTEFTYDNVTRKPDLVLFDTDEYLVAQIDNPKTPEEYAFQYRNAENSVTRYKALEKLMDMPHEPLTFDVFKDALNDSFHENRLVAMNFISNYEDSLTHLWKDKLIGMAKSDPSSEVRSDAIIYLDENISGENIDELVREASKDSSYLIAGSALYLLLDKQGVNKDSLINKFKNEQDVNITLPLANYFVVNKDSTKLEWFENNIKEGNTEKLFYMLRMFGQYLMNAPDDQKKSGAEFLHGIALNNNKYYIRIAAYQGLELISDLPEVEKMIEDIQEKESDDRVINYFN